MVALSLAFGTSCTSAQKPAQVEKKQELDLLDEQNGEIVGNGDLTDDESLDPNSQITHPKEPSYEATRALIMAARQPQASDIQECRSQVEGAARDATNEDEMARASRKISVLAKRNFRVYHWCFYQLVVNLDEKLRSRDITFDQQSEAFLSRMRLFLPFSKAMDQIEGEKNYSIYLRQRYLDLSQRFFGRNLQPIENFLEKQDAGKTKDRGREADIFDEY